MAGARFKMTWARSGYGYHASSRTQQPWTLRHQWAQFASVGHLSLQWLLIPYFTCNIGYLSVRNGTEVVACINMYKLYPRSCSPANNCCGQWPSQINSTHEVFGWTCFHYQVGHANATTAVKTSSEEPRSQSHLCQFFHVFDPNDWCRRCPSLPLTIRGVNRNGMSSTDKYFMGTMSVLLLLNFN